MDFIHLKDLAIYKNKSTPYGDAHLQSCTWEAEAGGRYEFEACLAYRVGPYLKQAKNL